MRTLILFITALLFSTNVLAGCVVAKSEGCSFSNSTFTCSNDTEVYAPGYVFINSNNTKADIKPLGASVSCQSVSGNNANYTYYLCKFKGWSSAFYCSFLKGDSDDSLCAAASSPREYELTKITATKEYTPKISKKSAKHSALSSANSSGTTA